MFYDLFCSLCKDKGISPTRAALEIGLSKSTPTTWKNRGLTPQGETLSKIASYFGVTVDYLLGKTEQKNKPSAQGEELTNDEIEVMKLFGALPKEKRDMAIRHIQFLLHEDQKDHEEK